MDRLKSVGPSIAALAGVIAAGACCLPAGTLLAAAGLGGASNLLPAARPYLMLGSVALVGLGFYQAYAAGSCARERSRVAATVAWLCAAVVGAMLLFPQTIAGLLADLFPHAQ